MVHGCGSFAVIAGRTGPSNDKNAEWPAITTTGKPVAGPGVHQSLLGRVYRKGVGWQATYAGHPLYLFSHEALAPTASGGAAPAGNGNGVKAFGGTFRLVVNP